MFETDKAVFLSSDDVELILENLTQTESVFRKPKSNRVVNGEQLSNTVSCALKWIADFMERDSL